MDKPKTAADSSIRAAARPSAVVAVVCIIIVYTAWSYGPFVSKPPKHYPIVRCPDCHLVKQPPDECGHFTGWLWEECVDLVHRYPDRE